MFFFQINENDSNGTPALICAICLKDLSKAMHFRNKAIRSDKYFNKSYAWTHKDHLIGDHLEPEVRIKLEDEEELEKIKNEPFEDPNYELLENIDTMIGGKNYHLDSVRFVDVFSSNAARSFIEEGDRKERKTKSKLKDSVIEEFGSSSGVVRCKLCMKSFTSISSLQNHMKTVHQKLSEAEMHRCKFCNRYFKLKIYLNRHVARIHGTKKCGKTGKKKGQDSIFNKEDVSLYCEVS